MADNTTVSMNPADWAPAEPQMFINIEELLLGGFMLNVFGFGMFVIIAGACLYFNLFAPPNGKRPWGMIAYILILTAGNTVFTATNWKFAQVLFIEYRNYPGGPVAFFSEQFDFWANTVSNSAYVFCNFLVDGLVLYRCWAIWNHNYFVIALPALWFLCTTVLSALTTFQSAKPGSAFNATDVVIAVPYWSLTVAFNIVLTLLIVGRLFHMRAKLRGVLGDQHTRTYTSIAAMIYESAALYSVTGIAFIVLFARNSPGLYVILPFLGEVMCIAPLLIILRVALGRSFSSQTNAGVAQGSKSWRAPIVSGGKSTQGTVIGMSSVTHKAYDSSIGSRHEEV